MTFRPNSRCAVCLTSSPSTPPFGRRPTTAPRCRRTSGRDGRGTVRPGAVRCESSPSERSLSISPGRTGPRADRPAALIDVASTPPEGGWAPAEVAGVPGSGNGTFNPPPLVEAADTGPFFHNNAIATIEEAVGFFNSAAFGNSPSGRFLASIDSGRIGIRLEATQVQAVAAFLRVLNALENLPAAAQIPKFVLDGPRDDLA